MSRPLQEISNQELSRALSTARERKGWTLEQLARELWVRGFPTSQNKLWRLENKPPGRIDTELILWLEKVLEVELLGGNDKKQVLIEDVLGLLELFEQQPKPAPPQNDGLRRIHERVNQLLQKRGR